MIKLTKETTVHALGKGQVIEFPNSNMSGVVLDVFVSGTEVKYVVVSENLYYSVITMDITTGEYHIPEEELDLISIVGKLRQNLNK